GLPAVAGFPPPSRRRPPAQRRGGRTSQQGSQLPSKYLTSEADISSDRVSLGGSGSRRRCASSTSSVRRTLRRRVPPEQDVPENQDRVEAEPVKRRSLPLRARRAAAEGAEGGVPVPWIGEIRAAILAAAEALVGLGYLEPAAVLWGLTDVHH